MRIGILGGGQLAQMLALAGRPLGIEVICIENNPQAPAHGVCELLVGELSDQTLVTQLIKNTAVITLETENTPQDSAQLVEDHNKLAPNLQALLTTQDRLLEKQCFQALDIPCAPFLEVNHYADLEEALTHIPFPAILKTRRFGYDGKGQWVLRTEEDLKALRENFPDVPCLLEGFIDFSGEVSQVCVRNRQGHVEFYPLIHNKHHQAILHVSHSPFIDNNLSKLAQEYATKLLNHFQYIGVLTIEFFMLKDKLVANEMAPRVHNSGHLTIEGNVTSQFENHLRAICNLPLGCTDSVGHSAMVNCIGEEPELAKVLAHPFVHYHHYAKEPRSKRKLAHITINHPEQTVVHKITNDILALVPSSKSN